MYKKEDFDDEKYTKLQAAIAAIVEGDLNSLAAVRVASHIELIDAAAKLPQLFVSRLTLAKVLENWRRGLFAPEDVQRWASFVRRGYVSGRESGAICPIEIGYDANDEALIVEIVGRLDEIGDQVDGHIDAREKEEMLRVLRGPKTHRSFENEDLPKKVFEN